MTCSTINNLSKVTYHRNGKKELWNLFIQLNKLQIAWKWVQWNVKSENNNTLTCQNDSQYAKVLMTNAHA